MQGLMMNQPLSIIEILRYASSAHPGAGIVSVRTEGDIHRETYFEAYQRAARLAHGMAALGINGGDRVATLAWNGYRHFELYYALSGMGAICHTINPRLSAEQMLYILGHAQDRILCFDTTFAPMIEAMKDQLPKGLRLVAMTDRAHMPETSLDLLCYEVLLDGQPDSYDWPTLPEETAAALCYTSGTTGHPKGALYSHRSTVLHAMTVAITLSKSLTEGGRILPVVPLFHVNAWGLPYAAPLTGASLVMPGPKLDGASLFDLMEAEGVTSAWGVPTVWMGLRAEIDKRGRNPDGFAQVVVGGSAAPRSMIEGFENTGVSVCHAWGMTEMSPVGTHGLLSEPMRELPRDEQMRLKALQGRRLFGVELKIVDEQGNRLPHDGKAAGELFVRGNTIVSGYFNNPEASETALDAEGWFGTGDVATINPLGFLSIQDRSKDLIKSGGEWISSIDLENLVMACPKVANCAVIAVKHPKWDERPLLVVVPKGEELPTLSEIHDLMLQSVAKWQLPDAVEFVEDLPLTATGKVSKMTLRQKFVGYKLPDVC
ncbi:long-chain-fatty-acid--CoA ligase [Puniceibacterium sp. IMCC21224]|uniref:long-chain-fatty-acid--CoA ligase n=1 Tax=Puniceibacterium sp. IMCC21224 TaxID=1618204 RepID=UPI00064D754B|nr:long-chain-fatty-acid--CoA ligase [Puniceibacterium sp. IMCC21224]KMK66055.1 acyl-CoA synthetase (AMP-forming)/AMP-acid ligase II [Puniceibacterium sp. IMCC21224]